LKPIARIEDWLDCGRYLIGHIEGHPNQAQFRQQFQQTSDIVHRPANPLKEGMYVETQNTLYLLGPQKTPANEEVMLEEIGSPCYSGLDD
jgi:hypothetical protein